MILQNMCKALLILAMYTTIACSAVSDATWNAVIGKQIIIVLDDSQEVAATVISYKDSIVTIAKADGSTASFEAKKVNAIRMDLGLQTASQNRLMFELYSKRERIGKVVSYTGAGLMVGGFVLVPIGFAMQTFEGTGLAFAGAMICGGGLIAVAVGGPISLIARKRRKSYEGKLSIRSTGRGVAIAFDF